MAPESQLPDVLIAGAGIIGLSLALELRRRGAAVTVVDHAAALGGASFAAAGMLAAEDPHNPAALLPLARFSLSQYPAFLARIESLSGQAVPFQTRTTVQYGPAQHSPAGTHTLAEHSIDPRQLAPALLAAARAASVHVVEHAHVTSLEVTRTGVQARTAAGDSLRAGHFVHATGAWRLPGSVDPRTAVAPRKGQMLRVRMPPDAPLREVHRAEHIYVVPRSAGPQAGTALIGATVEDAGFDITTSAAQLQQLREHAAALSPATAFTAHAPLVEAWAGLRPSTPDGLPLLGVMGALASLTSRGDREWIATGHFRNGILLAPGTACALAALLAGSPAAVDLAPFAPSRFSHAALSNTSSDIRPTLRDNG